MTIVEEAFVELCGLPQWVTVRGRDDQNPLLVVVHGGPGMPYSVLTPALGAWEEHFTVVQWDRRGAGRTFRRHGPSGSGDVSFSQFVDDAIALRRWLDARLPGRSALLLSSSAGTLVALPLVSRHPELFDAWVACDFNAGVTSEEHAMPATLAWFNERGGRRDRAFLEALPADPRARTHAQFERLMRLRDRAAGPRGVSSVFLPAIQRLAWRRPLDLVALIRGMSFSSARLFEALRGFDARAFTRLALPLFVLQGERDPFTPASAARAWFDLVDAPEKHFELLADGGHAAAFARPAALLDFLLQRALPAVTRRSHHGDPHPLRH